MKPMDLGPLAKARSLDKGKYQSAHSNLAHQAGNPCPEARFSYSPFDTDRHINGLDPTECRPPDPPDILTADPVLAVASNIGPHSLADLSSDSEGHSSDGDDHPAMDKEPPSTDGHSVGLVVGDQAFAQ